MGKVTLDPPFIILFRNSPIVSLKIGFLVHSATLFMEDKLKCWFLKYLYSSILGKYECKIFVLLGMILGFS